MDDDTQLGSAALCGSLEDLPLEELVYIHLLENEKCGRGGVPGAF